MIYCDGATEPKNPGGASGIGCAVFKGREVIKEYSYFIPADPKNTNNVAEYISFIRALKWIDESCITDAYITIRGDSMMCVKQLNKEWGIKQGAYVKYAYKAIALLDKVNKNNTVIIEWIPRVKNEYADTLSKKELEKNNIKITERS